MAEVTLSRPSDHVAVIRIDRPEAMNALSLSVRQQIAKFVNELNEDDETRVIVLTGGEKVFAAGADVGELNKREVLSSQFRLRSIPAASRSSLRSTAMPWVAAANWRCIATSSWSATKPR